MKKVIIANWKMHPTSAREAVALIRAITNGVRKCVRRVDVVLAPSLPFLSLARKHSSLKIAAQDLFWENPPKGGAYTGEVSARQLRSVGATFVIVGHSERRALGETNDMVQKKLKTALKAGLWTTLCVGEHERKKDTAFPNVIKEELHEGLRNISKSLFRRLIIAYEPIWAVGTRRAATPQDVFEMTILIRRELMRMIGKKRALAIPILYGGSVDEKNAAFFMKEGRVDGLLVGGTSLRPRSFIAMIESIATL